jgi:hypothetical protein
MLTLKPGMPLMGGRKQYPVYAGPLPIGLIYENQTAGNVAQWRWSIHAFTVPTEIGPSDGAADDKEDAKRKIAEAWRCWLAWVGLKEIDGALNDPQRIGPVIEPLEDARAAMQMIREAVEELTPPGSLGSREHTGVNLTEEAEAIIQAIRTLASAPLDAPE